MWVLGTQTLVLSLGWQVPQPPHSVPSPRYFAIIVSLVIFRRFFIRWELVGGWNWAKFLGEHLHLPYLCHLRPLSTWNALNWSHTSRDVWLWLFFFLSFSSLSGGWGSLWVILVLSFSPWVVPSHHYLLPRCSRRLWNSKLRCAKFC